MVMPVLPVRVRTQHGVRRPGPYDGDGQRRDGAGGDHAPPGEFDLHRDPPWSLEQFPVCSPHVTAIPQGINAGALKSRVRVN
jgi:hypothetical protein